jgi:hypothetical protein
LQEEEEWISEEDANTYNQQYLHWQQGIPEKDYLKNFSYTLFD